MEERIEKQGLRSLLDDVELPLSSVLAPHGGPRHPARRRLPRGDGGVGPGPDGDPEAEVYAHAGEEFNLNSPPQLRKVLYEQLGLQPGKKTPR